VEGAHAAEAVSWREAFSDLRARLDDAQRGAEAAAAAREEAEAEAGRAVAVAAADAAHRAVASQLEATVAELRRDATVGAADSDGLRKARARGRKEG
jgi:hypothetical protein